MSLCDHYNSGVVVVIVGKKHLLLPLRIESLSSSVVDVVKVPGFVNSIFFCRSFG